MSKTVPGGLATRLAQESLNLATLVKIELGNGDEYFYTSHDTDITYDGDLYRADNGMSSSSIEQTVGTSTQDFTLELVASDDAVNVELIETGALDNARVTVYTLDYDHISDGVLTMFVGRWADCDYQNIPYIKANVRSLLSQERYISVDSFSTSCRADLGDSRCKVDIDALKISGAVDTVASKQTFVDATLNQADGYWNGGTILFTSGPNSGVGCEISSSTSAGIITTQLQFQFYPQPGDTFDIWPGCNKQLGWNDTTGDCVNRYANAINFRGEPLLIRDVPVQSPPENRTNALRFQAVNNNQTAWVQLYKVKLLAGGTTNTADVQDQSSSYGRAIPIIFGSARAPGVVVWASPKREQWGVRQVTPAIPALAIQSSSEHYLIASQCDFAVAFAQAGLVGNAQPATADLVRLYINGELVLDKTDPTGVTIKAGYSVKVYSGREDQQPDPNIEHDLGEDKTPAYRGMIYVVFRNFDLLANQGQIPSIEAEIAVQPNEVTPTKVFTELASYTNGPPITDGLIMDYSRNVAYDIRRVGSGGGADFEGRVCRVWSIVSQQEINRFTFPSGVDKPNFDQGASGYSARLRCFLSVGGDISNGMPLKVYDAQTGGVVSTRPSANGITPTSTQSQMFKTNAFTPGFDLLLQKQAKADNGVIKFYKPLSDCWAYATIFNQMAFYHLNQRRSLDWIGTLDVGGTIRWVAGGPMSQQMFGYAVTAGQFAGNGEGTYVNNPIRDFLVAANNGIYHCFVPLAGAGSYNTSIAAVSNPYAGFLKKPQGFGFTKVVTLGTNEVCQWLTVIENYNVAALIYDSVLDKSYIRIYENYYTYNRPPSNSGALEYWPHRVDGLANVFFLKKQIELAANVYVNANENGLRNSRATTGFMLFVAQGAGSDMVAVDFETGQSYIIDNATDNCVGYYDPTLDYGSLPFTSKAFVMDGDTGSLFGVGYTQIGGSDALPATQPMVRLFPGKVVNGDIRLDDLLLGYCVSAGYDASEVQVQDIEDTVHGSIINQRVALADVLGNVCGLFAIDVIESQGVIKFRRQAVGTSVTYDFTLAKTDLVPISSSDEGEGELIESSRDGSNTKPNEVDVKYIDYTAEYQIGLQQAKRPKFPVNVRTADTIVTYSVPVAMSPAQAQYWAQRALYDFFASGTTRKFRLGPKYHGVDPSDFLFVNDGVKDYALRAEKVTYNGDRSLSIEARDIREDNSIPPVLIEPPPTTGLPQPGASEPLFIDSLYTYTYRKVYDIYKSLPALDLNNLLRAPGYTSKVFTEAPFLPFQAEYFLLGDTYPLVGGSLQGKLSGDTGNYDVPTGSPATYGRCVNSLPVDEYRKLTRDNDTQLVVKVYAGTFASATSDATFLAGEKHALVGRNGRWELVRYKTVTNNGDGTVTISGFLRCCMDTRLEFSGRAAGDYFIDFDPSGDTPNLSIGSEDAGGQAYATVVDAGAPVAVAYGDSVTMGLNSARAPLPAAVSLRRQGNGDIRVYWSPVTRLPPNIPLAPDFEDGFEDGWSLTTGGWHSTDYLEGQTIGGICEVLDSDYYPIRSLGASNDVTMGNPANIKVGLGASPVGGQAEYTAQYQANPVAPNQQLSFVGVQVARSASATVQWRDVLYFTYTAAQQTADGLTGTEGEIIMRVAQMGAIYGSNGYELLEGRSEAVTYRIYSV